MPTRRSLQALDPDARPRRPAVARSGHGWSPDAALTLTDATVAVAVYLKAIRRRRTLADAGQMPVPRRVEEEFVRAAAVFGKAHGIEFGTWREFGVAHDVLHRAGIVRRHRRR